jgi:SRSO17 transposase
VVGVYATYVGQEDLAALVGSELYLPQGWIDDTEKREKAYIPEDVDYQSQAQIAAGLVRELSGELPFEWVLGDDEFGRARHFRDAVFEAGKGYVLDVPENTTVRRITKFGTIGPASWTVKRLTQSRPVQEWNYFKVRDAEKGPIEIRALCVAVATKRKRQQWVRERLLVVETLDASQRWYCLARTTQQAEVAELVRQAGLGSVIALKRSSRKQRARSVSITSKSVLGMDGITT